ncbi:1-acyl-sn-glycerol-3-phosphate acyltransferase [Sphingomonas sp. CGMCC 1.13654]|uniref:1-acyl-sn-glycerol-3-phosphate acyltransferase n=1 Tax=Sphingomonas chungangi TaxID=2683589 RepID=A0A838LC59_9SPHN|nr:lysophospholipid acyltransferase family protein [Sphingomonas chungangi]MBA2935068.1 1-acyl-sn-glycerol-3-phosphate acyltransferase [Sphingomonas chungangi]MVW54184.1 1-acyl-sn-glycerol-3-phosphate acyltransferase [Sphingomonas chungangi]
MRAWGRLALIVALLAVHLPLHGLWRLFRRHSPWPRLFLGRVAWACGIDVRVVGQPLAADVLYVANHLSWLDILVIAGATGSRFVAKGEVQDWPVIGWLAGLNDTVFVMRAERGRVHEQAGRLREALAEHMPVTLFPEGGTGLGGCVGPFRASLLEALLPPLPGVMLQPIALDYGAHARAIAWPDENDTATEAMRLLSMPGRRTAVLRCLVPIDPAGMPDRKLLSSAARAELCAALGESAPLAV